MYTITEADKKWMRRAVELSRQGMTAGQGGPFGAVIVKDGQVIAEGCNQVISSGDPTAHAEVVAIRQACQVLQSPFLSGCYLYTSCEPCPMCLGAIYWSRLEGVYYANTQVEAEKIGFGDAHIYRELNLPYDQRAIPFRQVLDAMAIEVMDEWLAKPDRVEY